jgi:Flp pilus assembly protein TadD/4-amino-4-deoxy-L-arabinose transferase-like glycosyltransferase
VAALAALVRGLYLVQLQGTPFPHHLIMDAAGYNRWALEIVAGNWLGDRVFYQEPLYPYILALIHLVFGQGLLGVYVIQAMVGVVNCILLQVLSARVVENRWAGLPAGLILAFYGPMVFYEAQVLKTVWTVFLLLVLMHVLLSAWETRSLGLWTLAGLLLALLGLVRGNTLLYVPLVLVWEILVSRRWGWARFSAALLALVLGVAIPLGAVMMRNYLVGGDWVLSSSHVGFNFYIGNHKDADGAYQYVHGVREDPMYEGEDARVLASRNAGRDLRPSEASAYWFSRAVSFIRDDPARWLWLEMIKLGRFVNAEEILDTWSPRFLAQRVPLLRLAFLNYALLLPPGLVGVVILFRRGARAHLVNLLILGTALSVIVFYLFGRYRMPVVPLFAVTSSAAAFEFVRWMREGQYEKPILAVLAVVLAAWVELVDIPGATSAAEYRAAEHCNLAVLYEDSNDPAKAKHEYDRALTVFPRYSRALCALGHIHLREGKSESARGLLHEAIQADPMNADARYLLAGVYYREGKTLNATVELEAAISVRPAFVEAHRDLGAILIIARDFPNAARVLEQASRLEAKSEIIWKNLGTCYYQLRDFKKARSSWLKALELADSPEEKDRILKNLSLLPVVRKP